MKNLSFDNGIKEYMINDDPNRILRINLSDYGILERAEKARDRLKEMKIDETLDASDQAIETEKKIREEIDNVFGEGTSWMVFRETYCTSLVNGRPMFLNFVEALMPEIERIFKDEQKKSEKNVSKYKAQMMAE